MEETKTIVKLTKKQISKIVSDVLRDFDFHLAQMSDVKAAVLAAVYAVLDAQDGAEL